MVGEDAVGGDARKHQTGDAQGIQQVKVTPVRPEDLFKLSLPGLPQNARNSASTPLATADESER